MATNKGSSVSRLPVSLDKIADIVVRSCAECPMLGSDSAGREVCQHPSTDGGSRVRGSLANRQAWCPLDSSPLTISAGTYDAAEAAGMPVPAAMTA